jgi:hypothetical protein
LRIPEGPGELGQKLVADMERITFDRIGHTGLANAERNQAVFSKGKSLAALRDEPIGEGESCIVIAAGPSIKRQDPIKAIKASGYRGAIIATESAVSYCLRNGVVPDLTVTLDPHATRIVRWFGDSTLDVKKLAADDYFRRQDMDQAFADELRINTQLIEMINRHGKEIRIAAATVASEAVVKRITEAAMSVYWWNPMYDDPEKPGTITRGLLERNGYPCVNAGGNVGTACWMMADAVLGKKHVALVGMDLSYYDETPRVNTQYYHELVELVGEENLDSVYMRILNPYLNKYFYTDPAYMWYRQCLLDLVKDAECTTYNCTEGGILFGERIEFQPLIDYLRRFT